MRIIVYGVGAIGGVVGAALARAGQDVLGIARGAQLQAIRDKGLRLRTPDVDEVVQMPCVAHPSEIDFRPDDAILLCMKTQHTVAALADLRDAGVTDQPIFCFQNGVENERLALRVFPNVHAVTVMLPGTYLEPGKVVSYGTPRFGILDIGRYPSGVDAADEALAAVLDASGFAAYARADVMRAKYGKLLVNLMNILQAAVGRDPALAQMTQPLQAEAEAVYTAAGIAWEPNSTDPRRAEFMQVKDVPGESRQGGSTAQSLLRDTGSVETDYMNGEISLLGRLHGVPTPLNDAMVRLGQRLAAKGAKPGDMTLADIQAELDQHR
ncbi:ketopantoate reductase family protein [Tropicibacter naphthalenivorans]|uniref:2-dehydropantoate 2-reductase n=1 Tax=Tropicibacter naphthalenivorans TaxID=441103 RepID=A0A0P1GE77_9RHOB|nr:2-dehydropantoate 2-reductase N-terminal domain-containing protein [Tropicibacter naphthalenivorans]CUH79512.1 2-dehydropantoate 2-reductase [Tropicibacter naphthalenivorans]SMC73263.1 ketopantoate reductase [Tropicibacter naphthalenivorans]